MAGLFMNLSKLPCKFQEISLFFSEPIFLAKSLTIKLSILMILLTVATLSLAENENININIDDFRQQITALEISTLNLNGIPNYKTDLINVFISKIALVLNSVRIFDKNQNKSNEDKPEDQAALIQEQIEILKKLLPVRIDAIDKLILAYSQSVNFSGMSPVNSKFPRSTYIDNLGTAKSYLILFLGILEIRHEKIPDEGFCHGEFKFLTPKTFEFLEKENLENNNVDNYLKNLDACWDLSDNMTAEKKREFSKLINYLLSAMKSAHLAEKISALEDNSPQLTNLEKISANLNFLHIYATHEPAEEKKPCSSGTLEISSAITTIIYKENLQQQDVDRFVQMTEGCRRTVQALSVNDRAKFKSDMENYIEHIDNSVAVLITGFYSGNSNSKKERFKLLKQTKEQIQMLYFNPANRIPLDKGWNTDFLKNFYAGIEGTSVNGLNEQTTNRIGLMVYKQFKGPLQSFKWAEKLDIHLFGNVLLTSSGEQSAENLSIEETLEVNLNLYFPSGIGENPTIDVLAIGPIITANTRKVNDSNNFENGYMLGIRFSQSPESYMDILFGKNEALLGDRWELRGQLPVAEILGGNLFLGGVLNLAKNDNVLENDSVRIYISWQVQFTDLFSFGKDS